MHRHAPQGDVSHQALTVWQGSTARRDRSGPSRMTSGRACYLDRARALVARPVPGSCPQACAGWRLQEGTRVDVGRCRRTCRGARGRARRARRHLPAGRRRQLSGGRAHLAVGRRRRVRRDRGADRVRKIDPAQRRCRPGRAVGGAGRHLRRAACRAQPPGRIPVPGGRAVSVEDRARERRHRARDRRRPQGARRASARRTGSRASGSPGSGRATRTCSRAGSESASAWCRC